MNIYSTRPAPVMQSAWINKILAPYVDACRFKNPAPSIELRPMGNTLGYASNSNYGGRICMSNRSIYWSKDSVIKLVIHEYCHRLVMDFEGENNLSVDTHGPEFFLVLMTLFKRMDAATGSTFLSALKMYDFADVPPDRTDIESLFKLKWQGVVLSWALTHYEALASSDLSAEELPKSAYRLWAEFLKNCSVMDLEKENAIQSSKRLKTENSEQKEAIARFVVHRQILLASVAFTAILIFIYVVF